MVLCKYFLQGTCRFGAKCANEHLDIKQLIKTDVESALNGKQWPISNFGPFKDKPCIPNFIEDQSFEEVRWLCYDSKQKNCLEQFIQRFTKEALDAKTKMNALLQMSPQVVDMLCRMYDTPADNSGGGVTAKSNNPFGMGSSTDAGSIFSKPATTAASSNIFGSSFGSTAVQNAGGSLFGGVATTSTGGVFGGSNAAFSNQQQSSIFGQQMAKPTPSIFGAANNQNSLFGQAQPAAATGGGLFVQAAKPNTNLFNQAVQQQPQPVVGGGLFNQQQQAQASAGVGLFGQAAQQQQPQAAISGNLFAQAMQQQAQPVASANLFAQAMQQQVQAIAGSNLFVQAIQQQQPQPQPQPSTGFGLFSQAAKQTAPVFGQQNPFVQAGQPLQQQPNASLFGQVQSQPQQQQPAVGGNIFAQAQTPQAGAAGNGLFSNNAVPSTVPTQNVFGQTMVQQPTTASIFGAQQQPVAAPPPAGFFQSAMQAQPNAQQSQNQSPFAQKPMGSGGMQPLLQSPVVSSTVYSKLEDLSAEDIEAFKADFFEPGKIPNVPPPRELIN